MYDFAVFFLAFLGVSLTNGTMRVLAYIDPGLGALIWQSIIGVLVGMLFYLRRTRKWMGRWLGRVFRIGQKAGNGAVAPSANKAPPKVDDL